MQMQEPEQHPYEQGWQEARRYSDEYTGKYEPEKEDGYIEVVAGGNYQQEKLHAEPEIPTGRKVRSIVAIVLSAIGFFIAVASIVFSAILLQNAPATSGEMIGGVIGLIASILVLLLCIAVFVTAVTVLAVHRKRSFRLHRRT